MIKVNITIEEFKREINKCKEDTIINCNDLIGDLDGVWYRESTNTLELFSAFE